MEVKERDDTHSLQYILLELVHVECFQSRLGLSQEVKSDACA